MHDEHVERLDLDDDRPDLVVVQVVHHLRPARRTRSPTTTARCGVLRRAWAGCTSRSLPDEAAAARRHGVRRPRRGHLAGVPRRPPAGRAPAALRSTRAHARRPAADPARPDQAPPLPRAELDRRLARLPAPLRLLLQGRVLRGRPLVLHAERRRRAGRDRAPAGPPPVLPRRPPVRQPPLRDRPVRRHARAWAGCGRRPAPSTPSCAGPAGGGGRRRAAQPVRRLRDAQPGEPARAAASARTSAATTARSSGACTTSA